MRLGHGDDAGAVRLFRRTGPGAGIDPQLVGALVAVVASAGRTMSPVAAIVLMSASMTGADPLVLVRRVMLPLACAVVAVVVIAAVLAQG